MDNLKKQVGIKAAEFVKSGMVVQQQPILSKNWVEELPKNN